MLIDRERKFKFDVGFTQTASPPASDVCACSAKLGPISREARREKNRREGKNGFKSAVADIPKRPAPEREFRSVKNHVVIVRQIPDGQSFAFAPKKRV